MLKILKVNLQKMQTFILFLSGKEYDKYRIDTTVTEIDQIKDSYMTTISSMSNLLRKFERDFRYIISDQAELLNRDKSFPRFEKREVYQSTLTEANFAIWSN